MFRRRSELIARTSPGAIWFRDELADAWRAAQDDALGAYRAWQRSRGISEYVVYRAAQDRADQAQDVLASKLQRV